MWKPVEGTPLGRLNPKCETNVRIDMKLMNCDDEHWIELAKVYVNLLNLWTFMTFMIILIYYMLYTNDILLTYLITYLLHSAESFLRS